MEAMRLGNNLRSLRLEESGLSQEELARRVGVTRQTIISIEKGRFVPSTLLALRLAACFGKHVEEVFHLLPPGATEQNERSRP